MAQKRPRDPKEREAWREHRRRRFRRHGRRAYIRSVYFLPSLATLGNAVCGFAAIYVSSLDTSDGSIDRLTVWFASHSFVVAAYFIFLAMVFDALDGRLARFTRHTTDFGGQLDSLADVISFGAAPAFIALQVFRSGGVLQTFHDVSPHLAVMVSRAVWAIGALYMSCAALRLARFNVSNEHGEQHHFSFLGLPSPGAGAVVAAFILMQQDLWHLSRAGVAQPWSAMARGCIWVLPLVVLFSGLLMVSNIRYPHMVNRHLRGRRSMARLVGALVFALLFLVAHRYVMAIGALCYMLWGPLGVIFARLRRRSQAGPLPPGAPQS